MNGTRRLAVAAAALVTGVAAVIAVMAASDNEDPQVLSCKGGMQGVATLEYADDKVSVFPSADAAVENSDIWKFEGIPEADWRIVDEIDADGILPIDPNVDEELTEGEELGFREYAVRQAGETKLLLKVEPVGDGFRITGTIGC